MRLFIAIQFTKKIKDSLAMYQQDLKAHGLQGNFTNTGNLHLTLAFIGEYPDADAVLDVMESVEFRPFLIRLSGAGSFGNLFWAGIEKNEALNAYVKRLRRALAEQGIPYDRKKFSPHITLIRKAGLSGGASYHPGEIAERLRSVSAPEGNMMVERISLMRSDRGRHGMIYTEIGSV